MKIREKIRMDISGLIEKGPITIVAFGDSVTHGYLAEGEMDYETVYWNLLRKRLNEINPLIPVNVINAGIGGISAVASLGRMEAQVLDHHPDLVIVCFGLNDVNGELETYLTSLETIFCRCQAQDVEVIFMTPNMLNTRVAEDTPKIHWEYAHLTAGMQNDGKMDLFMENAVALAERMGVTVCNCYARWKELSKTQDVTMLLANRINHPTRQMHKLFAQMLFETIFPEQNP